MSSDTYILNGISDILNGDNIKPGIDIRDLERKMINGGLIQKVKDPQDKFNEEMKDTARRLGINFNDFSKPQKSIPTQSSGRLPRDISIDDTPKPSYQSPPARSPRYNNEDDTPDENPDDASGSDTDSDDDDERTPSPKSPNPPRLSDSWKSGGSSTIYNDNRSGANYSSGYNSGVSRGDSLHTRTVEEERRAHINSVNAEMGASMGVSFEREKREDAKCQMLEEIDSLMFSLQEEEADLSRIPRVDKNSTFDEVEGVLKMLRHKNDRSRYCSFAEEFLLFGAYGLEELFDGKRTWFGRYRPDLTGWHNHVNVKLRRMRHDTSTLVSGIMQDYNIGPGARLLLELVPNMVLYSKMRKQQHDQPSLYSDEEINQASNRIRDI